MKNVLKTAACTLMAGSFFVACGDDNEMVDDPNLGGADPGPPGTGGDAPAVGGMGGTMGGMGGTMGGMGGAFVDTTPPQASLTGGDVVTVDCGETFVDPGVDASDDSGETPSVETTGMVSTMMPGEYELSYEVSDSSGNTTELTRTVYVCGPLCGVLGRENIDLSGWEVIEYDFSHGASDWTVAEDGLSVVQSENSNASIFLSDFDATDLEIEGKWTIGGSSDNDYVGFVFGYQDRGHFYLMDWKKGTQNYSNWGEADVGMALKVVSIPKENGLVVDPVSEDLWDTFAADNNSEVLEVDGKLLENDIAWEHQEEYTFFLEFHAGSFKIEIYDSANELMESWSVEDDTYVGGKFGFYNLSQDPVTYEGFTQRETPAACSTVGM